MFAQGTELTLSVVVQLDNVGARRGQFFPEFSIFATGYVHQDAAHQVRVFNDPLMDPKKTVEDELGVKLLS